MYGKLFERMYTGSMMGAGAMMFAVWPYVIAHMKPNRERTVFTVELNTALIAVLIGESEEKIAEVIQKCCEPDLKSRTSDSEGRKLIKKGPYLYEVVNGSFYDRMKREDELREDNRRRQEKHYYKTKNGNNNNNPVKKKAVVLDMEIPDGLRCERFKMAWEKWLNHRKEIKKPMTPTSTKEQLKACLDMGEERAIKAIERSVAAGWTGIFEGGGPVKEAKKPMVNQI
jgi:hypothetical protein